MLVSAVQWCEWATCMHISPPSCTTIPLFQVITEHWAELPAHVDCSLDEAGESQWIVGAMGSGLSERDTIWSYSLHLTVKKKMGTQSRERERGSFSIESVKSAPVRAWWDWTEDSCSRIHCLERPGNHKSRWRGKGGRNWLPAASGGLEEYALL